MPREAEDIVRNKRRARFGKIFLGRKLSDDVYVSFAERGSHARSVRSPGVVICIPELHQ